MQNSNRIFVFLFSKKGAIVGMVSCHYSFFEVQGSRRSVLGKLLSVEHVCKAASWSYAHLVCSYLYQGEHVCHTYEYKGTS